MLPEGASSWIVQLGCWACLFTSNRSAPNFRKQLPGILKENWVQFFLLTMIKHHTIFPQVEALRVPTGQWGNSSPSHFGLPRDPPFQ